VTSHPDRSGRLLPDTQRRDRGKVFELGDDFYAFLLAKNQKCRRADIFLSRQNKPQELRQGAYRSQNFMTAE
jgi:hypothetical protein